MSDIAIRVENLSKLYHLGRAQQRHDTLRDALVAVFSRQSSVVSRQARLATGSCELKTDNSLLWALRDISFEVKQGEVVGIIGRNGAGKSTLLKILSRITEPTSGRAEIHGRVASLLEVGTGFHPELTGRENIYLNGAILGMHRAEIDRKFDEIVAFAEIERFLDTPVKRYSSGMYVRLAFAVAAHLEPEILLVDEVLAVGDAEFQRKCLGKMEEVAEGGRTVLFVSHNMSAIGALCGKTILLNSGQLSLYGQTQEALRRYIGNAGGCPTTAGNGATFDLQHVARRFGPSSVRLNWAKLMNDRGEVRNRVQFGDPLRIRLGFEAMQPVKVALEVFLKSHMGQNLIYFASSHFHNLQVQATPGQEVQVELRIPHVPLARGRYSLDLALGVPYVKWFDYIEDACYFEVEVSDPGHTGFSFEQNLNYGLAHIDHSWSVVQEKGDVPDMSAQPTRGETQ